MMAHSQNSLNYCIAVVVLLCSVTINDTKFITTNAKFVPNHRSRPRNEELYMKSCLPDNYVPVVGILTKDCYLKDDVKHGSAFLDAQYVKFAESGGIRVVPILLNRSMEYYEMMYTRINGLLLPGGGVYLGDGDYYNVTKLFFKWASRDYEKDNSRFPIFAICMGFEVLMYISNDETDFRFETDGTKDKSLPLDFSPNAFDCSTSQLFCHLPDWMKQTLATEAITPNFHRYSLLYDYYLNSTALKNSYNVLSTSFDGNGLEFVSTVEHKWLPIYALQWHPEKPPFVFKNDSVVHSVKVDLIMQYFVNFLSAQLRTSCNVYPYDEFAVDQIWNYNLFYYYKYLTQKFYFN